MLACKGKAAINRMSSFLTETTSGILLAIGRRKSLGHTSLVVIGRGQWFLTEAPSPANLIHTIGELGTKQGTYECVPIRVMPRTETATEAPKDCSLCAYTEVWL